ncbi:MAG: DNA polymerase III subunit beta [Candidatus Neomarinimicrobiota bacterium]
MEISTSKNELQSALQKLSKAVPSRSTLPILSCVLIEARETGTLLRTTDLEISIVVSMPASITEPGSAAIPLQTLLDITAELPEETRITLAVDSQNKVEIKTDMGEYDIMGKPPEEFPALPEVDNRKATGISAPVLKDIIAKTGFAVSRDELKPALTGVLFRFGKDELTSVATDGHRLVRYIIKDFKTLDFTGDVIVPRKFLNLLGNALTGQDSTQMWLGENHLTAALGADSYYTRIIDERYPDYQSVIPENNEKKLSIERMALLSAVRRVSIFSNKATKQIALRLNQEKTLVTTEDPEKSSKAQEELPAEFSGEDLVVGYNAQYLKDILSHLDSDSIIINLKTPISAALFYPDEQQENSDLTMLLMPIRLND